MSGLCFGLPVISHHASFPRDSQVYSRLLGCLLPSALAWEMESLVAISRKKIQIGGYFRSGRIVPNKAFCSRLVETSALCCRSALGANIELIIAVAMVFLM